MGLRRYQARPPVTATPTRPSPGRGRAAAEAQDTAAEDIPIPEYLSALGLSVKIDTSRPERYRFRSTVDKKYLET